MSNEQPQVHRALAAAGIALHTLARVTAFEGGAARRWRTSSPTPKRAIACGSLVIVGARFANDALHGALSARRDELERAGIASVTRIGDALAPGAIVHAVYSGHRYARELDGRPAGPRLPARQPLARPSAPLGAAERV